MAAPGSFVAGQVLTAAEMNNLPGGVVVNTVLGGATLTTTAITTTNQNILVDSTTLVSGRKYLCLVSIGTLAEASAGSRTVRSRIFVEGARVTAMETSLSSGFGAIQTTSFVFTATGGGGNHYVDIDTNSGTVDLVTQDDVQLSTFLIIDLGTN